MELVFSKEMIEIERKKELEHNEELLKNCIEYLWEIWNNEDTDTILKGFRHLGFTDKDLNYWYITEELNNIDNEFIIVKEN